MSNYKYNENQEPNTLSYIEDIYNGVHDFIVDPVNNSYSSSDTSVHDSKLKEQPKSVSLNSRVHGTSVDPKKYLSSCSDTSVHDSKLKEQPKSENIPEEKLSDSDEDSEEYYSAKEDEDDIDDASGSDDDVVLKLCLKSEKLVSQDISSELHPNPPEFANNENYQPTTFPDNENNENNQREETAQDNEICNQGPITSQSPDETFCILIWDAQYSKRQVGHVALLCVGTGFYISWGPGNLIKKIVKKPPGIAKECYEEDLIAGRQPDHKFLFTTSKVAAIQTYWEANKGKQYHLFWNNCAYNVYMALREADAPEFIPVRDIRSLIFYYFDILTPGVFLNYCNKNFREV